MLEVARPVLARCAGCKRVTRTWIGDPVAGRLSPPFMQGHAFGVVFSGLQNAGEGLFACH